VPNGERRFAQGGHDGTGATKHPGGERARGTRLTHGACRVLLAGCRKLEFRSPAVEMSENTKDRARINVNEPSERAYWCQKFGCSETQLRNAVKMVGATPSKVRAQLAQLK
jgi:hypothetical protein